MVEVILKNDSDVVSKTTWMRNVWEEEFDVKPNMADVTISSTLQHTEKEWLHKVIEWVYDDYAHNRKVVVNGRLFNVDKFIRTEYE